MRIGLTYNLKTDLPCSSSTPLPEDVNEELDLPETIEAIQKVLEEAGHEVFPLGGDWGILEKIRQNRVEFVFNIAEGFKGRNREAHIPALLELAGIPYSGSDPLGLCVTLDKPLTKRIALSLGIPTPAFWILDANLGARHALLPQEIPDRFPFFVKPAWQGSSKGIRKSSRVETRAELAKELTRLFENYPGEPVLVEEYIPGQEVTVGVLGNEPPEILGVMEIAFKDPKQKDFCYSLETKRNWRKEVDYYVPARISSKMALAICESALSLFRCLGLRDVARFDFRVGPEGPFSFLEANPLPGLSPESGDLVILAQKKGWSYEALINKITQSAFSRYGKPS